MVRPITLRQAPTAAPANFKVYAPDQTLARQVAAWAAQARREIQLRWFGAEQTAWTRPVVIRVYREHPGFYGTEFSPDAVATITLWAGDRHLESTVRHEVCHAVLHLHFPNAVIPRWIDEGIAVCNESQAERDRQVAPLGDAPRRFSLRQLANLRDYPRDVFLFYAQSYSVTDFLVRRHGEANVIRFVETLIKSGQDAALSQVLGYTDWEQLEGEWLRHVQRSEHAPPTTSPPRGHVTPIPFEP